jgi:hypothetical protein
MSGGGIRSATFALGVLQALARSPVRSAAQPPDGAATGWPAGALHKASLLSRFDYLSTVSGGGYVGAFLCSIFLPGRLRAKSIAAAGPDPAARAADDAVRVLLTDPPSRMRSGDAYTEDTVPKAPLAWLRDNGRYLTPSGGGDMVYALCLSLRNWVAVHYVIGTALLGLFSFSALFTTLCSFLRDRDAALLEQVLQAYRWTERFWWSPLWWLAGLVLLLGAVPAGLAFWLSYPGPRDRCDFFNRAVCGYIAVGLGLLALASSQHWLLQPDVAIAPLRASSLCSAYLAAGVLGLSLLLHGYNRRRSDEVATLRVESTRQFTATMVCVAVIAGLALVETAGRSLYIVAVSGGGTTALATPAALIAALVGLARQATALFGKTRAPSSWLGRLPLSTLGGAAGVLILALVATGWSLALAWLQWGGGLPTVEAVSRGQAAVLCVLTLMAALLAALTGQFPGFINLSSLQSFYSARLTRAYLGASNGRRFIRTPGAGAAGRRRADGG